MSKGHHFIVLHITADDADEIKVCMDPTQGTVGTLDETGVVILQMKDDKSQKVKIEVTKDGVSKSYFYRINGMTFAAE